MCRSLLTSWLVKLLDDPRNSVAISGSMTSPYPSLKVQRSQSLHYDDISSLCL
jgi:hypothetical protein